MTLAIAHRVGDMVVLDAAREIQPPFNPDAATTEFSALLKAYGVGKVIGDRYTLFARSRPTRATVEKFRIDLPMDGFV
jgi:hypothetical protein